MSNTNNVIVPRSVLEALVGMAQSHVEDIQSGVKDGTYDAADNLDIEAKRLSVESAQALLANSLPPVPLADALAALKTNGLMFGDCISAFAAAVDDPYAAAARNEAKEGEVEVDDCTVVSISDDGGAYVMAWIWINNSEAGILYNSELLEKVLEHARTALAGKHDLNAETMKLRNDQADWLEDLISNYADELDEIENEVPIGIPGQIKWLGGEGATVSFMPSDALNQLRLLARIGGLPDNQADEVERFCVQYGNKLDAILTVIQTA